MNRTDEPGIGSGDEAPVVRLQKVYKSFGDNTVLDGVDMDVAPRENVVVLGHSGAGKSVLLKLVIGLLEPDRGRVEVLGHRVHELPRAELDRLRAEIGFAFQHSALYDSITVEENLRFPLEMSNASVSAGEIDDRVEEMLDAVGLPNTRAQMPAELSGGQRKRIGMARALIRRPKLMLYDEPTAGLDPETCAEINDLMLGLRERFDTAALLITHDLTSARAVGDRVAMLLDGRIDHIGPFDEVFDTDDPRLRAFYDYNFTDTDDTPHLLETA